MALSKYIFGARISFMQYIILKKKSKKTENQTKFPKFDPKNDKKEKTWKIGPEIYLSIIIRSYIAVN